MAIYNIGSTGGDFTSLGAFEAAAQPGDIGKCITATNLQPTPLIIDVRCSITAGDPWFIYRPTHANLFSQAHMSCTAAGALLQVAAADVRIENIGLDLNSTGYGRGLEWTGTNGFMNRCVMRGSSTGIYVTQPAQFVNLAMIDYGDLGIYSTSGAGPAKAFFCSSRTKPPNAYAFAGTLDALRCYACLTDGKGGTQFTGVAGDSAYNCSSDFTAPGVGAGQYLRGLGSLFVNQTDGSQDLSILPEARNFWNCQNGDDVQAVGSPPSEIYFDISGIERHSASFDPGCSFTDWDAPFDGSDLKTNIGANWAMDETTGARADSSANALTLSELGGAVGSDTAKILKGAKFVAANSRALTRASSGILNPQSRATWNFWTNFTQAQWSGTFCVAGKGVLTSNWSWVIYMRQQESIPDFLVYIAGSPSGGLSNYAFHSSFSLVNRLSMLSVVYDGALTAVQRLRLYVNATEVVVSRGGTIPNLLQQVPGDFRLGNANGQGQYWNDWEDEFSFWSGAALTQVQLRKLFNNGHGLPWAEWGPSIPPVTGGKGPLRKRIGAVPFMAGLRQAHGTRRW